MKFLVEMRTLVFLYSLRFRNISIKINAHYNFVTVSIQFGHNVIIVSLSLHHMLLTSNPEGEKKNHPELVANENISLYISFPRELFPTFALKQKLVKEF